MAIPLIAMVGLLGYVVTTTVDSAVSLDRAPNLVNATAVPAAKFGTFVEAERTAAVIYLFRPSPANLQAYQAAIAATDKAKPAFTAAMTSEATTKTETADAAKIVHGIVTGMNQLPKLRDAVKGRVITPIDALGFYSSGFGDQVKLFLTQTVSVVVNDQQSQAIGLIATVQAREQLAQEHALLAGMLAGHRMTQKDRVAFTNMAATRQADMAYANFILTPAYLAKYNGQLAGSGTMRQDLAGIEQAIVAGTPVAKLPVNQAQWQHLASTLLQDQFNGGVAVANAILDADHRISHSAWTKVAVTSAIGLIGLLLTITVTILVARSIIRRLGGLERNALQLAENQLPDVVGRLRRGENVDVNAEAPALRIGRDEIGRVGQAFDLVRQTAIRAAVEEARLRQGLNDVFRSLARRSQSLLHRQLSLLDQMERRATDPEALDDLFRLDHLTTRMRRHAEGLVILAGAPPGRGWSSPVRMVDVMRGAIAEVEDYARVSVATRSQAALAGSAVADVIHLLAELIENATTLSPPYTSVRVSGETVANGFVIEVEDRGLGMSPTRLAELNDRLANPPEFNPSDSEQLGLFVVSQLAKRHGIRVTLKASPYGGTAAIALIPQHLVVTEEAFRTGLPGEPVMAQLTANGNHAVPPMPSMPAIPGELAGQGSGPGLTELGGMTELGQAQGVRISGALRRSQGSVPGRQDRPERTERPEHGAHAAPALGATNGSAGHGPDELPRRHHDQPGAPGGPAQSPAQSPAGAGAVPFGMPASSFDVFTPRPQPPGETPGPDARPAGARPAGARPAGAGPGTPSPGNGAYIASPPYPPAGASPFAGPGSTPFPTGGASYPDQPAPFPGWTLHSPPGAPGGRTAAPAPGGPAGPARPAASSGPAGPAGPVTPMTPVASPRPGQASGPPWTISRETGPLPAVPGAARPGGPNGPAGSSPSEAGANGDYKGLPRRVKQASLAPQLRDDPPPRRTTLASSGASGGVPGSAGSPGYPGPSPAEIRQTMSSLQRGWQEGRAQRIAEQATGESPGAGPGSPAGAGPGTAPGDARNSSASEEARGGSDGS
ncbi:MAG TPA: nitrate- and nitrite sensing domain-containing protein [Streptosporangiaceae bacterium]|nr:nitrate- and nitrite sensing domain-containing protein [Streptosporangiaceae bacterium]